MSSHQALILQISAVYVGLIGMLRVTVDATSETHRGLYRMVEYANDIYDRMTSATSDPQRLHLASMCLAIYNMISDTEGVSRVVIDRMAQCDVQRRRKRLRRLVDSFVVPTVPTSQEGTEGGASVSSMATHPIA